MPSIIKGYNYDIFISYRQNDNKYDGWVTEFVDNLNKELDANIKDKVSVYFDINPTDGLLETDSVDKSLEGKLRCLIFIPIISRTYCDPKSFAWQHEFCAFLKLAKEDKFGRDIKLASGNVASRILPVKIHDLDPDDTKLIENELGEVLRGIEFIYKEAGVNRPLKPDDDAKENLNKTNYRNQINKVANAIKEIISAIQHYSQHPEEILQEVSKPVTTHHKSKKTPIIIASVVALVLIILGILFIPKLFKQSEELEKSIAVLPFRNDSSDPNNQHFIDGTMEAILDNLCKIADLTVKSRTSVEQFRNTARPVREIANILDVNYILEGSGQKDGNDIRLYVQLIDAVNDNHIWSSPYEGLADNIFKLQSQISEAIASELKAIISPEEKQLIEKIPTTNLGASELFYQARGEHLKFLMDYDNMDGLNKAMAFYRQALQLDSTYAQAYSGIAWGYMNKYNVQANLKTNYADSMIFYANKALNYYDRLDEAFWVRGYYYDIMGNYESALKEYDKAIEINPNNSRFYTSRANLHLVKLWDTFSAFEDRIKAVQLEFGPYRSAMMRSLGSNFHDFGFNENARYYNEEALKLDNDSISYLRVLIWIESYINDSLAVELCDKVLKKDPSNLSALVGSLLCYERLGMYENAYQSAVKILKIWEEQDYSPRYDWDYIGYAFLKTGHLSEASYYFEKQTDLCEEILKLDPNDDMANSALSRVYAVLGKQEEAIKLLKMINDKTEVRFENGTISSVVWQYKLKFDPLWENIREDPFFLEMIRRYEYIYNITHEKFNSWLKEKDMLKE